MLKPNIILDTNVVLNAFFFQDSNTAHTVQSLLTRYSWISTLWMQNEALRVANSRHLAKYATLENTIYLSEAFNQQATLIADCLLSNDITNGLLRCKDIDDQIFLNLALYAQADILLTLDRDLLKLKKRGQSLGILIIEPFNIKLNIKH
jgi:putative PIN family toxin of toxin-antitoxin system